MNDKEDIIANVVVSLLVLIVITFFIIAIW